MLLKEFTNIYIRYTKDREINILFFNQKNKNTLLFDGWEFCLTTVCSFDQQLFVEFDYSKESKDEIFEIDSIRQDFDITFIKFLNGDIFQIYFMMDDIRSQQMISIIKKNESGYSSALKRLEQSDEEIELQQCALENDDVLNWLDRKIYK